MIDKQSGKKILKEDDFHAFLAELDPLLCEYLESLSQAGIRSPDDVRALIQFSRENLMEFLKKECGMGSSFEVYKVLNALDNAKLKLEG